MTSKTVRYVVKKPRAEELISDNTSSGLFESARPVTARVLVKSTRVGKAPGSLVDVNRRLRGQRQLYAESSASTKAESTD